jgi:hypothetical protein
VSADAGQWSRAQTPQGLPDTADLDLLIEDAAARATAMLAAAGSGEPFADDDRLIDAVRMLATPAGTARVPEAARLTGLAEDELRRLVLAYRYGGAGGAAAALGPVECGDAELAAAVAEVRRQRVLAVGDLAVSPGTITDPGAGVRVRLGPDGRWHPFTLARQEWWPAARAAESAGAAYQAALRARSLRRA